MVVYHNISFVMSRGTRLEASERLPSRLLPFNINVLTRYPVDTLFHYKYQLISLFSCINLQPFSNYLSCLLVMPFFSPLTRPPPPKKHYIWSC